VTEGVCLSRKYFPDDVFSFESSLLRGHRSDLSDNSMLFKQLKEFLIELRLNRKRKGNEDVQQVWHAAFIKTA
jgi:hypothetical protein